MAQQFTAARDNHMTTTTELIVRQCSECQILYAIPVAMREQALDHGGSWWCPNGHNQSPVAKTATEKLEEERNRSARLAAQRDQERASARAQKAAATRARNERDRIGRRAKAGICPCCNRRFKQLARHMKGQHPDYDPAANE